MIKICKGHPESFSLGWAGQYHIGVSGGKLHSVHPESLDRGWTGTSSKPLVIGRHPRHRTGNLLDLGAFLAVAVLP